MPTGPIGAEYRRQMSIRAKFAIQILAPRKQGTATDPREGG